MRIGQINLLLNLKKTEYLTINMPDETLKTIGNVELRKVDDPKYLRPWVKASNTDFR